MSKTPKMNAHLQAVTVVFQDVGPVRQMIRLLFWSLNGLQVFYSKFLNVMTNILSSAIFLSCILQISYIIYSLVKSCSLQRTLFLI